MSFTVITTSSTAYAQCSSDSNNFSGGSNGQGFASGPGAPGSSFSTTDASSAQDCCNQCAANPLCAGTLYYSGFSQGQCQQNVLSSADQCTSPGQYSLGATLGGGYAVDQGFIISNGNCGLYNYYS